MVDDARVVDLMRRAVVKLDDGSDVAYRDVRRFGTWVLLDAPDADAYLAARPGEEPLGRRFDVRALTEPTKRDQTPAAPVSVEGARPF